MTETATATATSVDRADAGVLANSRVTGSMGAVIFLLLVAEGVTILLRVRDVLPAHVFIGMLLVPPVAVKTVSTGYRIVRYYTGNPAYVRKGPPPVILRLLGPAVTLTTVVVLASGIGLLFAESARWLREAHKLSFIVWFAAMAVHVLGHVLETPSLAAADWSKQARLVSGAGARRVLVVLTVAVAIALAIWSQRWIGPHWLHARGD